MDALEFGYQLMSQRPRLEALATWWTPDRQAADVAVRQALAATWKSRDVIQSDIDVRPRLYGNLRRALQARSEDRGRPS